MSKFFLWVISLAFIFTQTQAYASKTTGVGVMLGSYAAISATGYAFDRELDGGLNFNIGRDKKFHLHMGQVFHRPDTLKLVGRVFGWYYSLGGQYRTFDKEKSDDDYRLGARGATGLKYQIPNSSFKIFSELAGVFNVLPATSAEVNILLGMRYYF